ncbi:MAG: helix-turn-helix transcriptional regulator [Myxococcales bacterium]
MGAPRAIERAMTTTRPDRALARVANNVRGLREELLLTKAELARKAGISPLTLARIEAGRVCRVDTKRKIIFALGLAPSDKDRVFGHGTAGRKGR